MMFKAFMNIYKMVVHLEFVHFVPSKLRTVMRPSQFEILPAMRQTERTRRAGRLELVSKLNPIAAIPLLSCCLRFAFVNRQAGVQDTYGVASGTSSPGAPMSVCEIITS